MRLLLFIVFLSLPVLAIAQQPFVQQVWLNEQSAPVKTNVLIKDDIGYEWAGTDEGLYRFNGRNFFRVADSVQKPVTALAFLQQVLYIGYSDGSIGRLYPDNIVRLVKVRNSSPSSAITAMYAYGPVLWLCTEEQGIFAIVNNTGFNIDTRYGLSDNFVYTLAGISDSVLIVGTDKGINTISFSGRKLSVANYTTAQGLPDNIVRVVKKMNSKPLYWCGTQQGGLALFNSETKTITGVADSIAWVWGQVNDILPMNGYRAWVATEEGWLLEVQLDERGKASITPFFIGSIRLRNIVLTRSGVLHAATNTGIEVITAEYMRYIPMAKSYNLSEILAMACDRTNTLWYALGEKLYRLPLYDTAHSAELAAELPVNITCLYADKENRIWIGTFGKGMWYYDKSKGLIPVGGIPPLVNESILDITGTSDRLWVAGLNGVQEIFYPGTYTGKMDLLKQHNKRSGIGSDYVYQLFADRKERIWMATDGAGIAMYRNGGFAKWDSASQLASKVVYSVTEDAYGNIWAATLSDGLYHYNGTQWNAAGKQQGVQDMNISTVAANTTGQVVVVNNKGIDVWYPQSGLFRNYPRKSFGIDSNSTVLKLSANDAEGNVYIPFEDGFIVFRNIYDEYDIRPAVNIRSASVFFKEVEPAKKSFAPGENHLSFQFESINFANADKLHYRYKLDGYNDSWIVTSDEAVTFPQLRNGSYTFRVQASLNNMFSKASEATYSFTIAKPVWKRYWFISLAVVLVFGLTVTYVRARERNLRKLSSLQRERMMFEYEHLKSQVNPHFLFNSLNTLTSLIEEDRDAAIDYTTRLSDLYRSTLSFHNKDLVTLAEEWEILDNYIFIQHSRFGNALQLHIDVPRRIKESKRIVPMALQLLVENAIKHNIVSASRPLSISITATEDTISVQNSYQPKMSKEKGAGLGIVNIKKRYSLLTQREVGFGIRNNQYIVTLPLL